MTRSMLIRKIYNRLKYEFKNTEIRYDKLFIYKINNENINLDVSLFNVKKACDLNDIKEIYEERGGNFKAMYKRWLQLGYICFIAIKDGVTLGVVWLNNTNTVPLEFGYYQTLINKEEAGLIDAYVLKKHRGKGIYKAIWNEALTEAAKMGITTLYGYVLKDNIISIRVHYRLGMEKVCRTLYYYKILWFRFYYLKSYKTEVDIFNLINDGK